MCHLARREDVTFSSDSKLPMIKNGIEVEAPLLHDGKVAGSGTSPQAMVEEQDPKPPIIVDAAISLSSTLPPSGGVREVEGQASKLISASKEGSPKCFVSLPELVDV